jgi:hypothetical protein
MVLLFSEWTHNFWKSLNVFNRHLKRTHYKIKFPQCYRSLKGAEKKRRRYRYNSVSTERDGNGFDVHYVLWTVQEHHRLRRDQWEIIRYVYHFSKSLWLCGLPKKLHFTKRMMSNLKPLLQRRHNNSMSPKLIPRLIKKDNLIIVYFVDG